MTFIKFWNKVLSLLWESFTFGFKGVGVPPKGPSESKIVVFNRISYKN